MTQTARAHPRPEPMRLPISAVGWERIQLVIEVPADGLVPDPPRIRLRRLGGHSGESMAPTSVRPGDAGHIVRFNIMQGPDQMPLELGSWVLEATAGGAGAGGGETVIKAELVDQPPNVSQASAGAAWATGTADTLPVGRFELTRGVYTATPAIDPATGRFTLTVELGPPVIDPDAEPLPPNPWTPLRVRNWVIRRLRRPAFQVLYRLARLFARRNGRRILFSSDSRSELGGNLKEVYDRMVARGLDRDHELLRIFKTSIADRRRMRDRFRLPWLLARADVILVDDYQPVIYRTSDKRTRIIQLWHASGAFKTVGYSRVGKPGGPSPYSRVHKNYTHAIVSSDYDVPFYAEAFGIPEANVVPTGIPRMDRYFDEAKRAAGREAAYEAFPAARGRTTILFAPTFRGPPRLATYGAELLDYAALHALAVQKDAVVIFKMHPFVREPLAIPDAFADRLIDGSGSGIDVNDLMFVVDLLITDYSSIVFEFSTLGRPMLFFAYDLDEYVAERDFYVPFERFVPGRIVRTFDELLDAIRRDDYEQEKVATFARRHFAHLDGSSTDRVIDELVLSLSR